MKFYLANCTKQNTQFNYRLDFDKEGDPIDQKKLMWKTEEIRAGQQAPVGGELVHRMVADSLKALAIGRGPYAAAVDVSDVRSIDHYMPFVFSYDKPIPAAVIQKVMDFNQGFLTREGRQRRERLAVAAADAMKTPEARVSFEQLDTGGLQDGDKIGEGFNVDGNANPKEIAAGRRDGRQSIKNRRRADSHANA